MKITHNFGKVANKLNQLGKSGPLAKDVEVQVGYTANYALQVHENIQMAGAGKPRRNGKGLYWDPQGRAQAKFLEAPAREKKRQIASTIRKGVEASGDLGKGFVLGGLYLQRESQQLVPVDTGNLKGSAFTKRVK